MAAVAWKMRKEEKNYTTAWKVKGKSATSRVASKNTHEPNLQFKDLACQY